MPLPPPASGADNSPRAHFTPDGLRYCLHDPYLLANADSDLWNETLTLTLNHRGQAKGGILQPDLTPYAGDLRPVYIRDDNSGEAFSLPFDPLQVKPNRFLFTPGLVDLRWEVTCQQTTAALEVLVPSEDAVELWRLRLTNNSNEARTLSIMPAFPVGHQGLLDHYGEYDEATGALLHRYFRYYVQIPDYFKLRDKRNFTAMIADVRPDSWETSQADFEGLGGMSRPEALKRERLGQNRCVYAAGIAAMQFVRTLAPGESVTLRWAFGPAFSSHNVAHWRTTYLQSDEAFETARSEANQVLAQHPTPAEISTPDEDFNHYINHWLPRRVLLIGKTLRFNLAPQGRNAIQDSMAAATLDPTGARRWILKIWSFQDADGWLPHGMPMVEGASLMPITTIPHRDTNAWGPGAVAFYLAETGDWSVLDEIVPFTDGTTGTLGDHLNRGLDWLLRDRTERGLSRIGQGDWNDPLNMAGPEGRGESVWLTQALAWACDTWAEAMDYVGSADRATYLREQAAACRKAVNDYAWDGQWYARGTTDAGRMFGVSTDQEARVFLNAQSWAIISGTAPEERIDTLIESVAEHLETPTGPTVLGPAFRRMHEDIGKICVKTPGTGENGSIYCHAVTFWAYALYQSRRPEAAWSALRRLLTGYEGNPLERSGQLPLYIPNFFRGDTYPEVAGKSSHSPNTGTSAWYLRTVLEGLFGLRATFRGLEIDPQLPPEWDTVKVTRRLRGNAIHLRYQHSAEVEALTIRVNDEALNSNLLPHDRMVDGMSIEVLLPVE